MSPADRDRRRRGGPAGRRRRDWQGGPTWDEGWNGWFDEPRARSRQHDWGGDWHARGWSGDWRATAWSDPAGPREDSLTDQPANLPANDVPAKRVRIGDAERDQAVAMLSEHFVAGRLTQEEFEERSERATRARYADEFDVLFDELPRSGALQPVTAGPPVRRPGPPPAFLMIAPFLMIGLVVTSVALTAPWLLWGVFWIVMLGRISGGRRQHYRR